MKNGKYARRRGVASKVLVMLLAVTMIVGISVGGTLAWLSDKTNAVTNTFTPSTIDITLTETTGEEYKMVPGTTIGKDPVVKVLAGSEASWLFVKVAEVNNVDGFLSYSVITGEGNWTAVPDHDGYYYRKVDAVAAGTAEANLPTFPVIYYDADKDGAYDEGEENKVHVLETVKKEDMDALAENTYPKLVFTAAAVQSENITTVDAAWAALPAEFTGTTSSGSGGAQG